MQINSELLQLGVLDKRLPLRQTLSVSCANHIDGLSLLSDYDKKFNESLLGEITQGFHSKILKEMSLFNEEFLDVMNLSESDSINILHNYLYENEFNFIIVSSQIGMFAQDSVLFTTSSILRSMNSNTFYHLGKLGNIDCYIDAFKKWSDKEIICGKRGNSFIYNYELGNRKEVNTASFAPRVVVDLDYDFIFNEDSFLNLHFVNEYNPKYVQVNRDRKLDELL